MNPITRIITSPRNTFILFLSNGVGTAFLFWVIERRSIVDTIYWWLQTGTTNSPGDVTPDLDGGKLLAAYFMVTTFWLTLALGAHFVSWLFHKDSWTHEEQEEVMQRVRAIEETVTRLLVVLEEHTQVERDKRSTTGSGVHVR